MTSAHSNLGNALRALDRPEEAEASLREALQLKPDYAEAHNNIGIVLVQLGRCEEGIKHYEEALRLKPDYPIGRVIGEEAGKLMVMASPLMPNELTPVPVGDVKERKPWNVSMMPPGLINSLNEDELKDLIAYLQSGGNPNDKAFKK
jgi:tetratricopeptide (TPR) repeat protein